MNLVPVQLRGKRSAAAHFNPVLWEKLSRTPTDRAQVENIITDTQYQPDTGRSRVYTLENPIEYNNRVILSLRLKGVLPKVLEDGTIPSHQDPHGGYVAHPHLVRKDGTAYRQEFNQGEPEGSLLEKGARVEFFTAQAVGPELSDFAFGHGIYPELEYFDQRPGFVIYGMESTEDVRFWQDFLYPRTKSLRYRESTVDRHLQSHQFNTMASLFGQTLARFHDPKTPGFIHCFPHLGNIGIVRQKIVIRDLTDCLAINSLTPEQAYGYLLLDMARVFDEFCGNHKADDGEQVVNINFAHLLPHFIRGYFKNPPAFNITNSINSHIAYNSRNHDFQLSQEEETMLFLRQLAEQIINEGKMFNLPQLFKESPLSFISFMDQHFRTLVGMAA